MSNSKGLWVKVGAVMERKKEADGSGGGYYLKLSDKFTDAKGNEVTDVKVAPGSYLNLQDPRTSLDEAAAAGRMEESKAEYLKSKIPEYVIYEVWYVKKEILADTQGR